ncbi:Retron-type reverse transcriptase [Halobacillus karajensis]|uniref:reverse transcriptase domain-containing protein n=1 Tax=Halobacillus karajensis TaxID=195088 RepID=UPI0008A79068|nr:reverse transcriptase domain-containing protein [Halobacillus karajensis]SEH94673.1 Retron-type reverse transcriptase [Halobacillus karajensis]
MGDTTPAYKLFKEYYSKDKLEELHSEYIHNNTASGIDRMTNEVFIRNYNHHIDVINNKIFKGTYKFTVFREKVFIKNKNSNRCISIPTIRDKIVLKGLHKILQESFFLEQPLVQTVINEVKSSMGNYDSFLKIDIKDFFGSIDHFVLQRKLNKKIRKPLIQKTILDAIRTPTVSQKSQKVDRLFCNFKGVPQGLSISNALAEIYFQDLDKKYSNVSSFKFFRYIDDILVLCNSKDTRRIKNLLFKELTNKYKLKVNQSKCKQGYIEESGFEFLGYKVKHLPAIDKVGLTIKKSTKLRFEKSLVDMFTRYKHSKKISPEEFVFYLNNKITGSISKKISGNSTKDKKYGWVFFYSQIDDINVFYHLDWFIKKLISDSELEQNLLGLEIKSFVKTYYEIRYNRTKTTYIHRPDLLSNEGKKRLLINTFNVHERHLNADEQIERIYYAKVYKPIKQLEKDVQDFS